MLAATLPPVSTASALAEAQRIVDATAAREGEPSAARTLTLEKRRRIHRIVLSAHLREAPFKKEGSIPIGPAVNLADLAERETAEMEQIAGILAELAGAQAGGI